MLRLYCLSILASICLAEDLNLTDHWKAFKRVHSKLYMSAAHEDKKQDVWEKNVRKIMQHNIEVDMGLKSYKLEVNKFADYTEQEVKARLFGSLIDTNDTFSTELPDRLLRAEIPPANFDWRSKNIITSIKNQEGCGSCWSFSTAAAVEAQYAKKYKKLIDISEQELLDCVADTNCVAGYTNRALTYMKDRGIGEDRCYRYQEKIGQCHSNDCGRVQIAGFLSVDKDENVMKEYLYNYGPLVVSINAPDDLPYVGSDIYDRSDCKSEPGHHAVLLIGYGTDEGGKDFWTFKNSWGTDYGDKGFFRIARNKDMCSITNNVFLAWF